VPPTQKSDYEFEVGPRFAGKRVDQYLALKLPGFSRSYIQRLVDQGAAELDGEPTKRSQRISVGQTLVFRVPETQPYEVEAEDIPLDIVYQDADLAVVNKPTGMVVHPNTNDHNGTLVNALLFHIDDLSGINGVERPGIVHRIDKDTSGLLVVAKHDTAHRHLSEQFRAHSTDRLYVALCFGGDLFPREGCIESDIGRDPHHRIKMASVSGGGKHAVTYYRQVESYGSVTMVECALETGRTHQIRVHLSEKGHPLVGDPVYGGTRSRWFPRESELKALVEGKHGQLLHAATLGFIHPSTDEYIKFRCTPPERMLRLIQGLRQATGQAPEAPGPWDREESQSFGRSLI